MQLTAMVIDDSRIMRRMVMEALGKTELAQFEFVEAEDGADALDKFHPGKIDIVFADWNMPRMSGVQFVSAVRGMPRADHIPIFMVTSEKTVGKMEIALAKAGANGYICKPFTAADLTRHIGDAVRQIKGTGRKAGQKSSRGFLSKLMQGMD